MSGALHDPSQQCEMECDFHDLLVGDQYLTGSVHVIYDVTPSFRDDGDPPRWVPQRLDIVGMDLLRIEWIATADSISNRGEDLEGWGYLPFGDPRGAAIFAALEASVDLKVEVESRHRED